MSYPNPRNSQVAFKKIKKIFLINMGHFQKKSVVKIMYYDNLGNIHLMNIVSVTFILLYTFNSQTYQKWPMSG